MRWSIAAAVLLLATSSAAQAPQRVLTTPSPPSPIPIPYPNVNVRIPACFETGTLEVRAGATSPGNGTAASPFPTLAAAFEHARSSSACRLTVRVAAGAYGADLAVTRPTEILGASRTSVIVSGSVVNRTGSSFVARHLTLRNTPGPAVDVEAAGAATTLEDVTVSGARRFGVRQRGGRVVLRDVRIEGTVAGNADRVEGTALHLSGETRADLQDVLLAGNASGALVARGAAVTVVARHVTVRDTGSNPNFPADPGPVRMTLERAPIGQSRTAAPTGTLRAPTAAVPLPLPQFRLRTEGGLWGFGAVAISDGATLLAEDLRIERSSLFGLLVFANARAHVRRLTVVGTTSFRVDRWSARGGTNVTVSDGATLEVSEIDTSGAETGGLVVYRGWLTARSGSSHHNVIGVAVLEPRGDGHRCLEGLVVRDNERNSDFGLSLPVPDASDLSGETRPPPVCGSVAWEP